jgi:hypothetical protein
MPEFNSLTYSRKGSKVALEIDCGTAYAAVVFLEDVIERIEAGKGLTLILRRKPGGKK